VKRDFLITILQNIKNAKCEYRNRAALSIIENDDLFFLLIKETFNVNDILSVKASLILEWIIKKNGLALLLPHLNLFTQNLHKVHFDSSIRACSKICELIAITYHSKKTHNIQRIMTKKQKNNIIAIGFDWLITPQKAAVKAYTMNTLYLLGQKTTWVHSELKNIIATDIIYHSKVCEIRGKKILKLIYNNS